MAPTAAALSRIALSTITLSTAALLIDTRPVSAQIVLPLAPPVAPPWNTLDVFEPVPFTQFWEQSTQEGLAPEDTPVKTRQHPGYEPMGIRMGSWMFHPALSIGTTYDSNIFASNTLKQSDLSLTVHPSLRANTLWERHAIALQADLWSTQYRAHSSLNTTDASFKGRGRIDLAHDAAILTSFRAARLNEGVGSLSSPTGAVEPTPYDLFSGDITYRQTFNRITASAGVKADSYNFGSTRALDGTVINQDSRDGQVYTLHGRLDYTVSPKFGVFTAVEGNKREIRGTANRSLNSDGYRVLTGVNLEFTRLLTGEFGIGYANQIFDAASIGSIGGPAYRAQLTWSPTRSVDVRFRAEQLVTQASDTDASGIRADAFQIGIDYELRRNIVLSLSGTYETDTFFGQDRKDRVYASLAELKYTPNRFGSVSLWHRYVNRDSTVPSFIYDKHEVGINVTAQY